MEGEWGVHEASEVTILLISVDATQEHACMKSHEAAPWVNLPSWCSSFSNKKSGKFNYEIADTEEKA